jgi:hypothetical protein
MLDTVDIMQLLGTDRRTRTAFRGVFASDELPRRASTSSLFVFNTDPSNQPGMHWVSVYIDHRRHGEYFDSFGMHPTVHHFETFLNNNCTKWLCNTVPVQDVMSDACGYHCIFYAVHRCIGFELNAIMNMYTNDVAFNDSIVLAFVRDHVV